MGEALTGLEWVAEVMSLGLLFSGIAYGVWVTWVGGGLDRLPGGESNDRPSLNVIIPARDEQNDLPRTLESISTQNYPAEQMQVILVNDRSIDDTPEIMRSWASEQQFEVTVLDITETSADMAPKKHAVQQAMTLAKGEIIVTTDADTKHDSEWLSTVATHFAPEVGMVIGLTVRQKTPGRLSFWQKADIAD
ncbi:MAG: glycosyltransferase, partial [Candidatus Latescibacteria bacterium]|nr:glycosyltransferase [Candidatus Latescibacterota bacterium]